MPGEKVPMEKQLAILAQVARGDTEKTIAAKEGVHVRTVANIKARNPEALQIIQNKLIQHQVSSSKKILVKSQELIQEKLDKAGRADRQRDELYKKLSSQEIDYKTYKAGMDKIYDPTIVELNQVSKEAFHQSQIEENLPTSIPGGGTSAADLVALVDAIKGGDEVVLQRMVFRRDENVNEREIIDVDEDGAEE